MGANGKSPEPAADGQVLRWDGRVLTAADLRQSLNGQQELVIPARAIITPLAADELRARGVRVTPQAAETAPAARPAWGLAQDRAYPEVNNALQGLRRDGLLFKEIPANPDAPRCGWSRALAEYVARGDCQGGVVFCMDPALVCCVANKVKGLRAVAVMTVMQATKAMASLGANFVAVEMPGRTLFEIRQILRCLCGSSTTACPETVACTLRELDGHAHR
jgi:hypothetical protein